MRLLRLQDGGKFSLEEFQRKDIPRYAVLSHTWGMDHEELTFKDLMDGTGTAKAGYKKIQFCTTQAACDGLQFSWVDTCCIDKSSSAELSEAINSMFRWYHDAAKCYVYLPDVSISGSIENDLSSQLAWKSAFRLSRWFTRGWTLQELLAPTSIEFFSVEGERLGDRDSMMQEIHEITGISVRALQGSPLPEFDTDERMSWAANRETKREEDAAYSLLGIFDVHMPLLYGEGRKKALIRLHRKIKKALRDELQSDYDSPGYQRSQKAREDKDAGLTSTTRPKAERPKGSSDLESGTATAGAATLQFVAAQMLSQEQREQRPSSAQSTRSTSGVNRVLAPDLHRPKSVNSNRSGVPPVHPSDLKGAHLRSSTQRRRSDLVEEADLAIVTASTAYTENPTTNEGQVRGKDMTDVYNGFGEGHIGSPRSPTRPHSMRRRQSMQLIDLESKLDQLQNENRILAEFKAQAERHLHTSQTVSSSLIEKNADIEALKRTLDWQQHEVARLMDVNEGLNSTNMNLARQHSDRYAMLETQYAQATRELAETRNAHTVLSSGIEGFVSGEVQKALQDKDQEIIQLRTELDATKERTRDMQLAAKTNEGLQFLTARDEDYFDNACQQLCQHVQHWVLRFSKFSDTKACTPTNEINNDKTIDRLDNAILDGSDVDNYLSDRVKRRDIFTSVTMAMVWEFVFAKYLFGISRELRQKLKSVETMLSEVGPASAVHLWRATTLTILSRREAFKQQREQDTQAVVSAIIETLSEILPPLKNLEAQIEKLLTRVVKAAVELSIEMRCQRAEYKMMAPLQPRYDINGDLESKIYFNSATMNERSGGTASNEELEAQQAVVRIVLFPPVIKKGDDSGEGGYDIVVCPAQVLVARSKKAGFADTAQSNHSRVSMQSSLPF
ncbi:heterokaryon incompatibility protein-domain-containing protein [Rhexocercosporidium sp. MPI-PUGE-AT-0058]|nr:heterokaryon incompatibility protein-domain-containing protein [Rhexocercosporidium sp. MPI-PUGE-AT-0058]